MVEKGLKSRFSHVRDLILEEQSQAKRKRKRNDRFDQFAFNLMDNSQQIKAT